MHRTTVCPISKNCLLRARCGLSHSDKKTERSSSTSFGYAACHLNFIMQMILIKQWKTFVLLFREAMIIKEDSYFNLFMKMRCSALPPSVALNHDTFPIKQKKATKEFCYFFNCFSSSKWKEYPRIATFYEKIFFCKDASRSRQAVAPRRMKVIAIQDVDLESCKQQTLIMSVKQISRDK